MIGHLNLTPFQASTKNKHLFIISNPHKTCKHDISKFTEIYEEDHKKGQMTTTEAV